MGFLKRDDASTCSDESAGEIFKSIPKGSTAFCIWKIEGLRTISLGRTKVGTFLSNSAYLLYAASPRDGTLPYPGMPTKELKESQAVRAIHFWVGTDCDSSVSGAAALRAAELDSQLGATILVREAQGRESPRFLAYFRQRGHLACEAPKPDEPEAPVRARLHRVAGAALPVLTELRPLDWSCFSSRDVVLVDVRSRKLTIMLYKEIIDNLKAKGGQYLDLSDKNIQDDDAKFLAEALKGLQVSNLKLSNNKIGCSGIKRLSDVLRDIPQITNLTLTNNNIDDCGVKYLAEALINTQITYLDIRENNIGIDGAECLNKLLNNTKIEIIHCDISDAVGGNFKRYISWDLNSNSDIRWDSITLFDNSIGMKCAQFINKTFQTTGIKNLNIFWLICEEDVQYLATAFNNIKIRSLKLDKSHVMSYNFPYLVEIFKDSKIFEINVFSQRIGPAVAKHLAEFIKEVKVLKIILYLNFIGDEGVNYLAPALENSEVMYLDLSSNDIQSEGAHFLSLVLPNSKILHLNLCNNSIGVDGTKYLADGLKHSQVTNIHLHGNSIRNTGYHYLIDVVDDTNISWVNLHKNDIDEKLEGNFYVYSIPRNTMPIAFKISHIFKETVSLNPVNDEFEFIVPCTQESIYPKIELYDYAFLIRTLNNHPNSKVHIFHKICNENYHFDCYDFDTMDKINEFITIMPNKFNTFIENKLPDLIESFGVIDNIYVNLVKQFEEMSLCNVVQNLLLHRILYYVDENQEILHPYIYKMLHKYKMPLFSQQLEPDKIEKIISYYRDHQEIDGTHEIIDLLESVHF